MAGLQHRRRLSLVAVLALLVGLAGWAVAPVAAAQSGGGCHGCQETTTVKPSGSSTFTGVQVVVGPGGTATPIGGRPGGGGGGGGGCGGCYSELVPACGNGASVCLGPDADACLMSGGSPYYVLFFEGPGDTAGDITGYACLRDGQRPVPVEQITGQVQTFLDELVPTDAQVVVQPPGGALVRMPTLVRAGMSTAPITQRFFASGFGVTVTARPVAWTWDFGRGEAKQPPFGFPGAAYDGVDPTTTGRHVTHTYTTPGARQVQVTVTWEASYQLPGVGTVDAGTVERPSPPVTVQVRAARSELVRG